MEIRIQSSENSRYNLAFVKALLIKYCIEDLNLENPIKEKIKREVVKTLYSSRCNFLELKKLEHIEK